MDYFTDAQQALGWVLPQFYNIEQTIYEIKYPSFDYAALIPVVSEGNEWARGTLFFTSDIAGKAEWISGAAQDMPYADVTRGQLSHGFHMAGIGYEWNLEEINLARLEGVNLSNAKAVAARRVAEQFNWNIAMTGNTAKNWTGLLNDANVTAADVAANGDLNGGTDSPFWAHKSPDQILADINGGIVGTFTDTVETEMADTVLLPTAIYLDLATLPRSSTSDVTILNWLRENNAYTAETGRPLLIRGVRALATADPGGDGRAVVYRRDVEVVRMHMPMPHRFLPPFQKGSMLWEVAGIMRTGGVEIRRPRAVRYLDSILDSTP